MDETYIRIRGTWRYLYRAVDKRGLTVDFRLSEHRNIDPTKEFFRKAFLTSGAPMEVTLDGRYPSHRALFELRREARIGRRVTVRTFQYLNYIVEQDSERSRHAPDRCWASRSSPIRLGQSPRLNVSTEFVRDSSG